MLEIKKSLSDRSLVISLVGELDAVTSPEFEREVRDLDDVDEVTLDFGGLAYTSSAGLRVLLGLKRRLAKRTLRIENIGLGVREVLDMTGSSALLGV